MNIRQRAEELLLKNYVLTGKEYITPDAFHRDQWLWDSCFHAIVCAELGLPDLAKNEINRLLKWQREDGWIPHQIYAERIRKKVDIEHWLYKKEHRKFHSSITQPPAIAQAVEAINDPGWTQQILPALVKFYLYFSRKQDPDSDGLISVCHPCESGRDNSPEFDFFRPHSNKVKNLDVILFFFSILKLELDYKKLDWDISRIWAKNLLNVEDLMFNCIWIEGLRSLCRLLIAAYGPKNLSYGGIKTKELAEYVRKLADSSEAAIYKLCWDEKDKIFYNLDSQNRKIKQLTVSNLFPLILDNIPEEMHKALAGHLTNPDEFWTPYPIPSTAKSNPAFNPSTDFCSNWRGPVWINMNWFIIKGLAKHGYMEIAEEIADKSRQMVEREGFREFYNPLSGKGLRESTKGFSWSTLVITFPKILLP